jgi:hypothetical protein
VPHWPLPPTRLISDTSTLIGRTQNASFVRPSNHQLNVRELTHSGPRPNPSDDSVSLHHVHRQDSSPLSSEQGSANSMQVQIIVIRKPPFANSYLLKGLGFCGSSTWTEGCVQLVQKLGERLEPLLVAR